jgi:hypothetical protein
MASAQVPTQKTTKPTTVAPEVRLVQTFKSRGVPESLSNRLASAILLALTIDNYEDFRARFTDLEARLDRLEVTGERLAVIEAKLGQITRVRQRTPPDAGTR